MSTEYERVAQQIAKLDLSGLRLHRADPICPQCGSGCQLKTRQKLWACCDYSVTEAMWDQVRLHASVLEHVLKGEGIEYIVHHGVPISVEDAVSPTHLLPLFLVSAQDMGEPIGYPVLLSMEEISDEGLGPGTLLPYYVSINENGCSTHESLCLMGSAARYAVEEFRATDPTGASMDSNFISRHALGEVA